jgi:hypothetical protein
MYIYINSKKTLKNKFEFIYLLLLFFARKRKEKKKKNFSEVLNSATSENSDVALFKMSKKLLV